VKIPKELKVGKRKLAIEERKTVTVGGGDCRGAFYIDKDLIKIAKQDACGNTYTPAERSETFWHELTHAILYDMGNRLTYNEKFVEAFSKRLDKAIRSARF